jgi:hypothetical protein
MFLEMLDSKDFAGSYDFVYLPIDFQRVFKDGARILFPSPTKAIRPPPIFHYLDQTNGVKLT